MEAASRPDLTRPFEDRRDAGRLLAAELLPLAGEAPIVMALPRGGVPVAHEIARALGAPLDVLLVRKVGAPGHPEFGIGAVAEGGVRVLDEAAVEAMRLTVAELDAVVRKARQELEAKIDRYRPVRPAVAINGRTVIVVDDGLATGGTASAALRAVRARGAGKVILAVPVGAREVVDRLEADADQVVCLRTPSPMHAVGLWYRDFAQVPDSHVAMLLAARGDGETPRPLDRHPVRIETGDGNTVGADLTLPAVGSAIVVFAHGSGSGRKSTRNRHVADILGRAGLGTLLLDLLTEAEEQDRRNVFDIELLASRLSSACAWLDDQPMTRGLPVGFFGASTGAGAALKACALPASRVGAVVSRGGRPDLAGAALEHVRVPVLLIVGGEDRQVLDFNRLAQSRMPAPSELVVIPGATHLFEEPGALDEVARLAADWFARHLGGARLSAAA